MSVEFFDVAYPLMKHQGQTTKADDQMPKKKKKNMHKKHK